MFNCHNCNGVIDTPVARVIRGTILCPECRVIEEKTNELTLLLVQKNKLLSLARVTNACECKKKIIRTAITRIKEDLESLDYDFAERAGRGRFC